MARADRRSSVVCAAFLSLVLFGLAARAEEERTLADTVVRVTEAHAAGDQAVLREVLDRDEPDSFLVAEVLCARAPEVARAFAATLSFPDVQHLAAYVAKRDRKPPGPRVIEALLGAEEAWRRKDWGKLVGTPPIDEASVASVAIALWRGEALRAQGKTDEATTAMLGAGRIALRIGWLRAARRGLFQGAVTAHRLARYGDMLSAFEELTAVARAREQEEQAAQALFFQGSVHAEIGQYEAALAKLGEARDAWAKLAKPEHVARVLNVAATAFRMMGENSKALGLVENGLGLAKTARQRADLLSNLGAVHNEIGDHAAAVDAYKQALPLARTSKRPNLVARVLGNVGQTRVFLGEFNEAHAALTEALALIEKLDDIAGIATALTNLGYLEMQRGRPSAGLELCKRAVAQAREAKQPFLVAQTQQNVGECLLALERYGDAAAAFEDALHGARAIGAREVVVLANLGIAECHLRQKKPKEALAAALAAIHQLDAMVSGLAEGQGAQARAQHARLFEVAAEAAVQLDDATSLARVLEQGRAMALLESLEGREKLRAISIPEEHLEEERAARAAVAEARTTYRRVVGTRVFDRVRKQRKILEAAEKRLEAVIGRIRRSAKGRARLVYPEADDLATLQSHMQAGEALVLYGLTPADYIALVVEPKDARIVRLGARAGIDALCDALLASLLDQRAKAPPGRADLSRRILVPVALRRETKRVYVSPVGKLFLVPLATLQAGPAKEMVYVPSGTTYGVLRAERIKRGADVLALGGVDYSDYRKLRNLPESNDEAKAVGDVELLGADATEARLRAVLPTKRRWRAVHFACHGLLDVDRPMRSALALTKDKTDDGLLQVSELFVTRVPADLVSLSACESARGRIYAAEGVMGLPRAFLHAGAPRVLGSLWKVDDAATRALMTKFYESWNPVKGPAASAASALRRAQAHVRSHPEWKAPYYWAAWVLWGLAE